MIRLYSVTSNQNAPTSGTGEDRGTNDVVVWIQEHTNLCMVIACSGAADAEMQARFRETLMASADRGKQLVNALLVQKGELPAMLSKLQEAAQQAAQQAAQAMVPVAGSARGRTAIPLSGFKRFDDPTVTRTSGRTLGSSALGQSPGACLLPSRTYLKNSGG
jgi:hypothetical protein